MTLTPTSTSTKEPSFRRYFLPPTTPSLQGAPYSGVNVLAGMRDEVVDFHPPQLVGSVPEHLLERRVGRQEAPGFRVEQVDPIGSLLDHGPVALFASSQLLLYPLASDGRAQGAAGGLQGVHLGRGPL